MAKKAKKGGKKSGKKGGKKSASKKTPALSPDELAVLLEQQAAQADKERKERSRMAIKFLKEKLEQEEVNTRISSNKINAQWRVILRKTKSEELRREIEILSQTFERVLDRKEHIIQELLKDLSEAEKQEQMATRSHMRNVERLINFHTSTMQELQAAFEKEFGEVRHEFASEREEILARHRQQMEDLKDIKYSLEMLYQDRDARAESDFSSKRDEVRSKALDERTTLKADLESRIKQLWEAYQAATRHYETSTAEKRAEYERLRAKDMDSTATMESQLRRIRRLQDQISARKQALHVAKVESDSRNAELKHEKEQVLQQVQQLKTQLARMRERSKRSIAQLSVKAQECKEELEKKLDQAEKVLKEAEICRKLETEEEKVLPFYAETVSEEEVREIAGEEPEEEPPEDLPEPSKPHAEAYDLHNRPAGPERAMENFYKRYNKVLLDKLALDKEHEGLQRENEQLQAIMKQYLDGVSVSEDVLAQDNTLFVVNGRTNAPVNVPVGDGRVRAVPTTIIEGNQAARTGALRE